MEQQNNRNEVEKKDIPDDSVAVVLSIAGCVIHIYSTDWSII